MSREQELLEHVTAVLGGGGPLGVAGRPTTAAGAVPTATDAYHLAARIEDLPRYVVAPVQEGPNVEGGDSDALERPFRFEVRSEVVVPSGVSPNAAVDPFYVWAIQALVVADPTLGGRTVRALELGSEWELDAGGGTALVRRVTVLEASVFTADDPEIAR